MVTKIYDIVFDALHFTIRADEGDFIPSASAYAFGQRPNFLKGELRLRPNVKNTASVIQVISLKTAATDIQTWDKQKVDWRHLMRRWTLLCFQVS